MLKPRKCLGALLIFDMTDRAIIKKDTISERASVHALWFYYLYFMFYCFFNV